MAPSRYYNPVHRFSRLNQNNDPFGYLIEGILTHLDTYQWMKVHIFWPFWILKTLNIHPNGYCNFKSGPILVGTYVLTIIYIYIYYMRPPPPHTHTHCKCNAAKKRQQKVNYVRKSRDTPAVAMVIITNTPITNTTQLPFKGWFRMWLSLFVMWFWPQ